MACGQLRGRVSSGRQSAAGDGPYLRAAVDSIATQAGLLPIGLQPVNFEVLYDSVTGTDNDRG
jgi:hypothetical protein